MLLYYQILLLVGDIAGGGFIALYWYNHPGWIKSEVGKLLLTFSIVIFLFYSWYTLVAFWPTIPGRGPIRVILFSLMTAALVHRLISFFIIEAKIRRRDAAVVEEPAPE
jgi:hypothetical protein